jgi:hypothetical protein
LKSEPHPLKLLTQSPNPSSPYSRPQILNPNQDLDAQHAIAGTGRSVRPEHVPSACPPSDLQGYLTGAYSVLPQRITNDQIGRELLYDPAFTLDKNGGNRGENPVYIKIRMTLDQASWDSLADDFRLSPPCYVRVFKVFEDIRTDVLSLLGNGSDWEAAAQITTVLDMPFIKQRLLDESFEWSDCVDLFGNLFRVFAQFRGNCGPDGGAMCGGSGAQDGQPTWKEVQKALGEAKEDLQMQPSAFCSALRFFIGIAKSSRIDVANFKLRRLAPVIATHGVDHERKETTQKLHTGELTLSRTSTWLRTSIKTELEAGRVTMDNLLSTNADKSVAFWCVLNSGIVSLISGPRAIKEKTCPELLRFDQRRLFKLHSHFRMTLLVSTVCVVVGTRLEALRVKEITAILRDITTDLIRVTPHAKDVSELVACTSKALYKFSEMDVAAVNKLGEEVEKAITSTTTGICALMRTRLQEALASSLSQRFDMFENEITTAACFDKFKIPKAAYSMAPLFRTMKRALGTILKVNAKIYGSRLNTLLSFESRGFVVSRVRLEEGQAAPLGYRLVAALEAEKRIKGLVQSKSLSGASILRVDGGRFDRFEDGYVEIADGTMQAIRDKWVLGTEKVYGSAQTLVIPISIDLIEMKPGGVAPTGFRFVTFLEAHSQFWHQRLVTDILEMWSVVRFEGGKLDGSGYGGLLTPGDFSSSDYIGQALVTRS